MAILLNGAGASSSDPILKNLGLDWVISSPSMDVAEFVNAWVDTTAGFPGTSSVSGSLSPASTVLTSGNAGTYSDTTKRYTISSTSGLSTSDYIHLSHASLTAGVYKISTIPASGQITLVSNPLNGLGDKTGIAYQIAWKYAGIAGTAPLVSSPSGQINYLKTQVEDSFDTSTQSYDTTYVRDAPSGSLFVAIDGKDYVGQTTVDGSPSFSLLSGWTSKGGVSHVELGNHSVQGVNNFTWGDSSSNEKTLADAVSSGFLLSAGDGIKYGKMILKSKSSASVTYNVDMSITLDTAGPLITLQLYGR